jgi:hypothetical protein
MNWKTKMRNWLEIASDVSDVLIHIRDKPRPSDYASIGLKLFNSYLRHSNKFQKGSPFKDWELLDIWEYCDFLFSITNTHYEGEVILERGEEVFSIVEVHGEKIGWVNRGGYVTGPYAESEEKVKAAMAALGKMVWEHVGSSACTLTKSRNKEGERTTGFRVDSMKDDIYESEMAKSVLKRSKAFLDHGYRRSVMLYGRPGTGKSSAMRYVAKKFGKNSLRINVSELQHLDSGDMISAIEMLQPDTLLIDDFDRMHRPESLLNELERFNKTIKLFIVSVNHVEKLSLAVVRPGRFDDHIEVENIDRDIVSKLIGTDVPKEIHDRLIELPIAYISEFHKRKMVLGVEKAIDEIEGLEKRISHLSKKIDRDENKEDDEDDEVIFNIKSYKSY